MPDGDLGRYERVPDLHCFDSQDFSQVRRGHATSRVLIELATNELEIFFGLRVRSDDGSRYVLGKYLLNCDSAMFATVPARVTRDGNR